MNINKNTARNLIFIFAFICTATSFSNCGSFHAASYGSKNILLEQPLGLPQGLPDTPPLVVATPGPTSSSSTPIATVPGASATLTLSFAGVQRTYVLHVPGNYNAATKYPVVLSFHGNGGTGLNMETITGFDTVADANGFLVAYPDSNPNYSTGKDWEITGTNSDVDFSLAMLQDIESHYSVDTSKIFLSGYSKGGGMVEHLVCKGTGLFAGAAVISENLNQGIMQDCHPSAPIKFLFFHGTSDPISPYAGGFSSFNGGTTVSSQQTAEYWAQKNNCSSTPATTSFADSLTDGSNVTDTKQSWSQCQNNASVTFYTITGGGHTWPGGAQTGKSIGAVSKLVNASSIIWNSLSGTSGP